MKNIEITTSHNVKIEYQAAPLIYRITAYFIDMAVMWAGIGVIMLLSIPFVNTGGGTLFMVIAIFIITFYAPAWEIFNNGASPGKLALGLRVVKINSEPISIYDYFMRWAFRPIDIGLLGSVAMLTIISSPYGQRIGDFLADTTVIKVSRGDRITLDKIKQLDSLKKYNPVYREVTKLNEQDMLTVKEVVDRYIKFPNEAHKKAMDELIIKLEDILGVEAPVKQTEFLYTLIRDYVALTR